MNPHPGPAQQRECLPWTCVLSFTGHVSPDSGMVCEAPFLVALRGLAAGDSGGMAGAVPWPTCVSSSVRVGCSRCPEPQCCTAAPLVALLGVLSLAGWPQAWFLPVGGSRSHAGL